MAAPAKFALAPDPANPGCQTIMANRGQGWCVVCPGKWSEAENDERIARLAKQGIRVERMTRRTP
jgi:hypothetical protein